MNGNELNRAREMYLEKPLPSAPEMERCILGGIILDNSLISYCLEIIKSEDFYSPLHRHCFKAMERIFSKGGIIDPFTLKEEFALLGVSTDSFGGIGALTNLTYGLPLFTSATMIEYATKVKDKSVIRQFVKECYRSIDEALTEEFESAEVLNTHEQNLFQLRDNNLDNAPVHISTLIPGVLKNVQKMAQSGNALLGLSTGFKDLNEKTSGFQKTDLIVIAGRPSMGKTSLTLQSAMNALDDDKEAVILWFALETSKAQMAMRAITQESKIDSNRFQRGFMVKEEWGRLAGTVDVFTGRNIIIDDTPNLTVLDVTAKARRVLSEQKRLDMIVIDHLGLMKGSGRREKHLEVGEITSQLKTLAKTLKVPVVLLCQLSRSPEARNPPKPMMSDLRDSGRIEEDADVVLLLYRPEYYRKKNPRLNIGEELDGLAEVIIGKNKNGPTGTVKLAFMEDFTRFENYYNE